VVLPNLGRKNRWEGRGRRSGQEPEEPNESKHNVIDLVRKSLDLSEEKGLREQKVGWEAARGDASVQNYTMKTSRALVVLKQRKGSEGMEERKQE